MTTLNELNRARRSCRAFTGEPLGEGTLRALIEQAVWVPSGSNEQPWGFAVVTDRARLRRYSDEAKRGWLETLGENPHLRQYESHLRDPAYDIFHGAPALVAIYGHTRSRWHAYDCSMVAHNLMLLAQEAGLGSCWIGFAHAVLDRPHVKAELGLSDAWRVVAPIVLGHPAGPPPDEKPRKPFPIEFA